MLPTLAFLLFFASAPERSAAPASDWQHYLKDPAGTRYSTLDQINRSNVKNLRVAWTYHAGQNSDPLKTTIECNPLIIDGVMYITSPVLDVIALDAATGKQLWIYHPFPAGRDLGAFLLNPWFLGIAAIAGVAIFWPFRSSQPKMISACLILGFGLWLGRDSLRLLPNTMDEERRQGPNRGLTYWHNGSERRIYFAGGHRLVALDARTGQAIDSFGTHGFVDLRQGLGRDITGQVYAVTSPGVIYRDVIILGSKVGEGPKAAAPGHVRAFDLRTGQQRWIFHTIPQPGETGYETWPADAWKRAGGANAWGGLTLDEQRGLVFASTGSPTFDLYGADRQGTNLFGDSILALTAATGKLVWYYQVVHHDLWDYDLPGPPNLVTLTYQGRKIDAAVQLGKNGMIYVLDRETGKPVFPIEERPVPTAGLPGEKPWPTQPFPLRPAPLSRQQITEADLTDRTPAAHDYALKIFRQARAAAIYAPPDKQSTIVTPGFHGGSNWSGASFDPVRSLMVANSNDLPYVLTMRDARPWVRYRFGFTGFERFVDQDGYPAIKPPWGQLTAIHINTGDVAWRVPLGEYKELTARGIPVTGMENAGGSIITAGGLIFIGATKDERFRAFDIESGRVLWETQLDAAAYATPSVYSVGDTQYVVIAAGGGGMVQTRSGDEYIAFALPAR